MNKKDELITSCLGMVVGVVLVGFVVAILDGWALSTIWNWFIPPIFGLTQLTMVQAIGVALVFNLFTGEKSSSKKSDTDDKTFWGTVLESILTNVFKNIFVVVFAWIVLQFI